jgi:hypothetical protein
MRCSNCHGDHTANYPLCPSKTAASDTLNARINRTASSSHAAPPAPSEEDDSMVDRAALV